MKEEIKGRYVVVTQTEKTHHLDDIIRTPALTRESLQGRSPSHACEIVLRRCRATERPLKNCDLPYAQLIVSNREINRETTLDL